MNSKIILVKDIKLDRNYVNVLSYTENQMLELCESNKIAESNNYSFIRQNGNIWTNFTYSQCLQANYIAFQNPDYSNKWFFAFIDDIIYKGNENTEIQFTIDAWSTWYDYWTKKTCFIERQHVLDDTIGANIIEENLNVGDVIQEAETKDFAYSNDYGFWVGIYSNFTPDPSGSGGDVFEGISILHNVISGHDLFLFKITSRLSYFYIDLFLKRINEEGKISDVSEMFIIPNAAVDESALTKVTFEYDGVPTVPLEGEYYYLPMDDEQVFDPKKFDTTITKRTSFTNFTPKNNKCFVYPYNYLLVTNNQGSENIYKYEDFSSQNCVFENQIAVSIGMSGRIVPKNYKNEAYSYDESLPLAKYPTCGWSGDAFTNWLTQNAVNIPTQMIFGAISAGSQILSQNLAGGIMSLANTTADLIGQFYQASLLPTIKGGGAQGDISFSGNSMGFTFREMRVKNQYLKLIDDYFTKYGYAIKSLEMPILTGRHYWNYIEIGKNDDIGYGSVPTKYMESINNACRRGVTIWHNHQNLGDYSLNNNIL